MQNDRAVQPRIVGNLFQRRFHGFQNDVCTRSFVAAERCNILFQCGNGGKKRNAAARNDTFLHRSARRVQRVFDTQFLFFHFHFRRRAHVDDRYAAREFCKSFLQFFSVIIGRRFRDLRFDGLLSRFDCRGIARTVNNGRVVFIDLDRARSAQHIGGYVFEFVADVGGNHRAARQYRDIFEHRFSSVAEARSFYRHAVEHAFQLVDDQRGKRVAFHVFRDDKKSLSLLRDRFDYGQNFLNRGDFLIGNEDHGGFQHRFHLIGIGYHVGRSIAAVELHAFHGCEFGFHGLAFFNGDHAVLADFFHRFGNQFADRFVACGNRRNLRDGLLVADGLGKFFQFVHRNFNRARNAFFQNDGVCARRYVFQPFFDHRLREDNRRRRAVARHVVGLGGNFFHQLRAHVFERVF